MISDPGIILFGKKIGLPVTLPPQQQQQQQEQEKEKPCSSSDPLENAQFEHGIDEADDNPKTPSIDEEATSENLQSRSTDGETMNLQTKSLKKPDKILPCPRCDSMNTKFCYFNNSNVNQPRHFCKSCQRYWTAGGTMRNMPVGAGRRKKKTPPSSHYRYVIAQEALESESGVNQIEFAPDSNRVQPKVLSFGQNTTEGKLSGKENQEHCCSDSNGLHSQVHWIPSGSIGSIGSVGSIGSIGSWPYNPMNPWNTQIPISIPIPPYGSIPMYSSPYWTSVPWLPPPGLPGQAGQPGQPGSVLGKHMIDSEQVKPNGSNEESKKQRNTVLTPKTLRIDDPDEAAKSSIWATLGIKNENCSRGDLFKAFQTKGTEKKKAAVTEHELLEPCPVLQANPAAFSRSLCFQERA